MKRKNGRVFAASYYAGVQTIRLLRKIGRVLNLVLYPFFSLLRRTVGQGFRSAAVRVGEWMVALKKEIIAVARLMKNTPLRGAFSFLFFPAIILKRYPNTSRRFFRFCAMTAAAAVLFLTLQYWNGITYAVALNLDGDTWGYVSDEEVLQDGLAMAQARVKSAEGWEALQAQPTMALSMVHESDILDKTQVCDLLLKKSELPLTEACGLYVDGVLQGAVRTKNNAETLLESILRDSCQGKSDVTASFFQNVELIEGLYPEAVVFDVVSLKTMLTTKGVQKEFYTVEKDDTYASIAEKTGVSVWELMRLNPESEPTLSEGKTLLVRDSEPHLQVLVTGTIQYEVEVPFAVQRVADASKNKGYERTRVKGKNGVDLITANVTYLDGEELFSTIVSSAVVEEPVTQVVAYGTKEKNSKNYKGGPHANGYFVWPVPYTKNVTQNFFQNGHGALDINDRGIEGTDILAADGGVVVISAYRKGTSYGSYGKYIVIDHGGGYQTLYAHCEELLVDVGDIVKQGQVIAKVGSTGRSTAPHLHFEVLVNGRRVNPMTYFEK